METEEEQVEKLKAWFKENGLAIVLGVVIGIGGIGGYNYWISQQETAAARASDHFTRMLEALSRNQAETVQTRADLLFSEHGSSEYALMAHLALARLHVGKGDFEKAELELQQLAGSADQKPIGYVAKTRLALVQIQLGKYDQALATLSLEYPSSFSARVEELRGDAHALQGNTAAAIEAYRKAQLSIPKPANSDFLQQKLDQLGAQG